MILELEFDFMFKILEKSFFDFKNVSSILSRYFVMSSQNSDIFVRAKRALF